MVSESDSGDGVVFGRFTAALLEGIRTGNADSDRDGRISLHDLYRYLRGKVPGQTPRIFARAGGDPLVSLSQFSRTRVEAVTYDTTRPISGSDSTVELVPETEPKRTFALSLRRTLVHPDQVIDIAFNRDVTKMATICDDGRVRVFNVDAFDQIGLLQAKPGELRSVSWSRAGHLIATSDTAGFIRLWRNEAEISKLSNGRKPITCLQFSPDGSRIASGTSDGRVTMWHARRHEAMWTQQVHTGTINTIDFNDEGGQIVTASADGTVCVLATGNGRKHSWFRGHTSEVAAAFFISGDPDIVSCVSAGLDGQVCIWSANKDSQIRFSTQHTFWVRGLSYCAANQTIISAGYDCMIKLIDLQTGNVFEASKVSHEALVCLRTSPCGNYVGVATRVGHVHILTMSSE